MQWIGQYHPIIIHTPIVLLIFSALCALVGRLMDRDWLRKTSVLLLVFGFLGAFAAVQSGTAAHEVPEHKQGVPEHDIDEHGESGEWTMYLSGGALVVVIIASRLSGAAGGIFSGLALLLQVLAAVAVGVAGYRGGQLVFSHGANVRLHGQLVQDGPPRPERGRAEADGAVSPLPAGSAAFRDSVEQKERDADEDQK